MNVCVMSWMKLIEISNYKAHFDTMLVKNSQNLITSAKAYHLVLMEGSSPTDIAESRYG